MMKIGAFAMLDCLGFKGIWNRAKPEVILEKLKTVESQSSQIIEETLGLSMDHPKHNIDVGFLSDTIALGISFPQPPKDNLEKGKLVWAISKIANEYAKEFRKGDLPLVFRGCIGFGEFIIEGNFILGPIVDEVASHMTLAEGAFIWLLPDADILASSYSSYLNDSLQRRQLQNFIKSFEKFFERNAVLHLSKILNQDNWGSLESLRPLITKLDYEGLTPLFRDYPMPIKGAAVLRCAQANPFRTSKRTEFDLVMSAYLKAMNNTSIEVIVKKQNTETFLKMAQKTDLEFKKIFEEADKILEEYFAKNPLE